MPKVSIIIPVYNTERYLSRCLESVVGQTLKDFEVLCVDDFSTDGSLSFLERFASIDRRFKILKMPENRGLSLARNNGLDYASGEYVYFLDSDDWIDTDFLEAMCSKADEFSLNEVVNTNYVREYEGSNLNIEDDERLVFKEGFWDSRVIQSRFNNPAVWCRLFRKSCLDDLKLRFSDVRYAEDVPFSGVADLSQAHCYIFDGPAYHYYQRDGSLIRNKDFSYYHVLAFISLYNALRSRGIRTEGARLFATFKALILDTQEKFKVVHDYAEIIAEEVRRNPDNYTYHDRFLIDALLSCDDYESYLSRYHINSVVAIVKNKRIWSPNRF